MAVDYNKLSYVVRSKNRKIILEKLSTVDTVTPTSLSKELKLDRGYVSKILLELTKKGLTGCLTPKEVRHRLYKITERGRKINDYTQTKGQKV